MTGADVESQAAQAQGAAEAAVRAPEGALAASHVLALQRSAGNAAVGRLLRRQDAGLASRPIRAATLARHGVADAGVQDAGVPLPAGVPPSQEELDAERLRPIAPADLLDEDLGPALELAQRDGALQRAENIIDELLGRIVDDGFGVGVPRALPRGQGGSAMVTPQIALEMIQNVVRGRPAFRPELGVGGSSWFVTEGDPHTGLRSSNVVPVQVELVNAAGGRVYLQADLDAMYQQEATSARPQVEAEVRAQFQLRTGKATPPRLSNALADKVARQVKGLAERRMWERIGREVAASQAKVGEVVLPAGGRFSANPGRFKVIADAAKIRLRGGVAPLVEALRPHAQPVPALEAEAAALARKLGQAAKVRAVFRVGGKILMFVAIANDIHRIIIAEDKIEAVITSAAGWAGAAAGAAAFTALWAPADVAGPWAWAAHGVGSLVSGALGYWFGSETVRHVYRLVVETDGEVIVE
jgi:hypothetical protein